MPITLKAAIVSAFSDNGRMTYSEITTCINRNQLYRARDGLLVPVVQVRATIKENARLFSVDRSSIPHRISVGNPGQPESHLRTHISPLGPSRRDST